MALDIDITYQTRTYRDLANATLAELAVLRGEGRFASNGALVVETGNRTGRSPKDRFIVREPGTETQIDWGPVNQPVEKRVFDALWSRVEAYMAERDAFAATLHVGEHPEHYLPINVTTEYAWHALFAKALFITPESSGLETLADMVGERVVIGPAGAGFEYFVRPVLAEHDLTYDDFEVLHATQSGAVDLLADGSAAAALPRVPGKGGSRREFVPLAILMPPAIAPESSRMRSSYTVPPLRSSRIPAATAPCP